MQLRGKWAEGIEPRHFRWIVKDSLAICERPGGYGAQHRPVRRMEEIIWIRQREFDLVISIIDAPHNLHNYAEYDLPHVHRPITDGQSPEAQYLDAVYGELHGLLGAGKRILIHREELGDVMCGFIAGYLLWSGMIDTSPKAILVIEQMTGRQLGPAGRAVVNTTAALEPAIEQSA